MSGARVIYDVATGEVQMMISSDDPAKLEEAARLNVAPGFASVPLAQRVPVERVSVDVTRAHPVAVVQGAAPVSVAELARGPRP